MKKFIIFSIAAGLMFGSCSDFLEEYSQNKAYARNCGDLMQILVGEAYMLPTDNTSLDYFPFMFLMDDDVTRYINSGGQNDPGIDYTGWYKWAKEPGYGDKGLLIPDHAWADLYARIAVANTVVFESDRFPSDPLYAQVKGEAHFLRASYYYLLVNLYAQPYRAATAGTEPGVPLKLEPEISGKKWARTPVGEVYAQIVRDLQQAAGYLKADGTASVIHANESAAKVLLSRVYLYMGEWAKAEELCDEVLGTTAKSLVDLNTTATGQNAGQVWLQSPETIFSFAYTRYFRNTINAGTTDSGFMGSLFGGFYASSELTGAYKSGDLRYGRFISSATPTFPFPQKNPPVSSTSGKTPICEVFSLRLPEVYLNKAEAMAMQGKDAAAVMTEIDKLRVNRFQGRIAPPVTFTPATENEELVNFIRDERRRELCFEGHRWFDLRRYAVSPLYPVSKEIRHRDVNKGNVIKGYYILKPYAEDRNAYVLPIPGKEILYNEGVMAPNPRDEREMVNP